MLKREQRSRRRKYVARVKENNKKKKPSFMDIASRESLKALKTESLNAFHFGGKWFTSLFEFAKELFTEANNGKIAIAKNNDNLRVVGRRIERQKIKRELKKAEGYLCRDENVLDEISTSHLDGLHMNAGDFEKSFWWNGRRIFLDTNDHRKLIQKAMRAMIAQNNVVRDVLKKTARRHLLYSRGSEEKKVFPFSDRKFGELWEHLRPAVIVREKKYNYKREKKLNQNLNSS